MKIPIAIFALAGEFAQALVGLYTLGPGQFRAADVQETARAFTGYFVLRDEFRYLPDQHHERSQSAENTLRNLLANPATPRRVVRKLYRWLVSEIQAPPEELVDPLAEVFARDFDIAKLAGTSTLLYWNAGWDWRASRSCAGSSRRSIFWTSCFPRRTPSMRHD